MNNKIPKVFISYSWDNEIHKDWVKKLATKLRLSRVDVILDSWELTPGKDKDFFMENSVRESDKVLLIMTPNYKVKAENRKGGVGNEISMIRAEKFNYQETEKFIPILRSGIREESTPLFAKSLVDIDMSIEDNFEISFDELLRTIYRKPKNKKPPLGKKPQFTKPKKSFDFEISNLIEESQLNEQKNIREFDISLDLEQKHSVSIDKIDNDILYEEIMNPQEIEIVISDPAPIVILFGHIASGKKMVLKRLTSYLEINGYTVKPDRVFRPNNDRYYQMLCDKFEEEVYSDKAASRHGILGFMLLKVYDKFGRPICQILDAPGEHYFDESYNRPFPSYINGIIHAENQKVWICLLELDWRERQTRIAYAKRIVKLKHIINYNDKVILMCNKVDKHSQFFEKGLPITERFFESIKTQYPHIFGHFKNRNPTTKLFRKFDFDFIVFSAGRFHENVDGMSMLYTESEDIYPATLWKTILKVIKK